MALVSSGIFSKVIFIPEATFNTLPATPTMVDVPFVDCSLSPEITKVTDNTIQGDTMHRYVVPTVQKVAGTISGEVMTTNFDWLLQGVFYNTFASSILIVGATQSTYSIEVGHSDISQYSLYTGLAVDKLGLTFAPAAIVTYKADLIGAGFTMTTSTNASTTTAAPQHPPLTTVTATIKANTNSVGWISSGTINFDRKLTQNFVLGTPIATSLSTSFFTASGTLDILFEDEVAYGYFLNNTSSSLDWTLTDGTHTYEIFIPNMYYETYAMSVTGSGPVKIKCNFTAVYDPTTTSVVKITKS